MILVAGQALFDLIEAPGEGPGAPPGYRAHPGGSPFNQAIGLARLGRRVAYLGALSRDRLGERLAARLTMEGVSLEFTVRSARPTALTLVALGDAGEPEYAFYGDGAADRALKPEDVPADLTGVEAVALGCYALVVEPIATALETLTERAAAMGGRDDRLRPLIALDPNLRPAIEPDLDLWRRRVATHAARADLIKLSTEDLGHLSPGTAPAEQAKAWLDGGASLVAITDGPRGAALWSRAASLALPAEPTELADTVGAGDAFQAALIDAALARRAELASLDAAGLEPLLRRALAAAAHCCARPGADPPRWADLRL